MTKQAATIKTSHRKWIAEQIGNDTQDSAITVHGETAADITGMDEQDAKSPQVGIFSEDGDRAIGYAILEAAPTIIFLSEEGSPGARTITAFGIHHGYEVAQEDNVIVMRKEGDPYAGNATRATALAEAFA